jgi:hypothetical protein
MKSNLIIKLKKILLFFISIAPFYCHSQITDSIKCNIDFKEYENVIKNNIKERSVYTLKNEKAILALYKKESMKLLLDYKVDSEYIVTSIPIFKLKDNFYNNYKNNVLYKIDFSNNFHKQFLNIYNKDKIVYESNYVDQDSLDLFSMIDNSLILNSFDDPVRYGNLKGFLLKLGLERKYFAFFIEGCPIDHIFIVDNGVVYAIFNPTPEGKYDKIEINEYFSKYYDKKFIYRKKPRSGKKYKEKYFFKIY